MEFLRAANQPFGGYRVDRDGRGFGRRWGIWTLLLVVAVAGFLGRGLWSQTSHRARIVPQKGFALVRATALGLVSNSLGATNHGYVLSRSGDGGLQAQNPAQHLHLRFTASGVQVEKGEARFGLSLRAAGYGASLQAVGPVTPSASRNRAVYARHGLSEWYANGPLALEQGFTIPQPLRSHASGPLTLSLALSGDVRVALADNNQSLTITHSRSSLRYDGLAVTDGRGDRIRGWLELRRGRLLIRTDVKGAPYPIHVDPFIQQGGVITGHEENPGDQFGISVALSADGNTALVGADEAENVHGAAWIFVRRLGSWEQQGPKLIGQGELGTFPQFGYSVSLSSDGNTALVGGPFDNSGQGAAWIFTRSGSTWTQQAKVVASGEAGTNPEVGASVALSSDGDTALIGAPVDDPAGAAWVFTRSGSTWRQRAKLTPEKGELTFPGAFGASVALSSDGDTALVGAPCNEGCIGAAWIFTGSGETWTQQAKITGQEEKGEERFGEGVALSSDGDTALISGNHERTERPSDDGAGWVFTRFGSTWTQQGKKLTPETPGMFGPSVALSAPGTVALVGTLDRPEVFTRSVPTWTRRETIPVPSGADFGFGVALSADATTALIGGPLYEERPGEERAGGALVFVSPTEVHPTTTSAECPAQPAAAGQSTTCIATVRDEASSGATTPTGTVSFETRGPGSFSETSCTLKTLSSSSSSCSVRYTPSSTQEELERSDTITATYGGDQEHEISKGTTTVEVISAPPELLPTSKEECKEAGWKNFGGVFKNQGGCVSFVEAERHP